jgi:hypothetical protein
MSDHPDLASREYVERSDSGFFFARLSSVSFCPKSKSLLRPAPSYPGRLH